MTTAEQSPPMYWVLYETYSDDNGETKILGIFSSERNVRSAIHRIFLNSETAREALQYDSGYIDTSLISIETVMPYVLVGRYDESYYYVLRAEAFQADMLPFNRSKGMV